MGFSGRLEALGVSGLYLGLERVDQMYKDNKRTSRSDGTGTRPKETLRQLHRDHVLFPTNPVLLDSCLPIDAFSCERWD